MEETQNPCQKIVAVFLIVLTILLPLKFGSITGLPQSSAYYPEELFAWLIIQWPIMVFPVLSGLGLIMTALFFPPPSGERRQLGRNGCLWSVAFASAFLGVLNASTPDYAVMELSHLAGILAYALSIVVLLSANSAAAGMILKAAAFGTFLICLSGAEQYFFGFDRQAEFLQQQLASGVSIKNDLQIRYLDRRINASFTVCNTLAGYLLLTGPLFLYGCWQFFKKFEPPKITLSLFMPLMTGVLLLNFLGTKSRASFLALVFAVWLFVFLFAGKKRLRIAALAAGILAVAAGAAYIHFYGRGFDSMLVRFDYSIQAFKMMLSHPFAGTGWGDFFHDYVTQKLIPSDEAPHTPHNILMAFGSQCGIFSFLLISAAILYPMIRAAVYLKTQQRLSGKLPVLPAALWFGLAAFFIHALVDTHLQIPGLMATMLLLLFYLIFLTSDDGDCPRRNHVPRLVRTLLCLLGLFSILGGLYLLRADYRLSLLDSLCSAQNGVAPRSVPTEKVLNVMKNASQARPYSPFPYIIAADYFLASGQLNEARQLYEEALERSPERAATYYRLGNIARMQNRPKEAQSYLDEAARRFPHKTEYVEAAEENRRFDRNVEN